MANVVQDLVRFLKSAGEPYVPADPGRAEELRAMVEMHSQGRSDVRSLSRVEAPEEALSLGEAARLVRDLAAHRSVLLLAQPGVGKSALVESLAREAGLPCRSLLGTQIAPEDVSGVPKIVGERSVFCPPRMLLPEDGAPFCLFLDELPASAPDVQKAFYSILLERRIGEHPLPAGSWVVAAGNRAEDHALVRGVSSALVNRLLVLQVRADVDEWLRWARRERLRSEVRAFIHVFPDALCRPAPRAPAPFSTPRSWHAFSDAWSLAQASGELSERLLRALLEGFVSAEDVARFLALRESFDPRLDLYTFVRDPARLPDEWSLRDALVGRVREEVLSGRLALSADEAELFLLRLPPDVRNTALVDAVDAWGALGVRHAFRTALDELIDVEGHHDAVG